MLADPVVDSSTFSDLQSVVDLNVGIRLLNDAVTSTLRQRRSERRYFDVVRRHNVVSTSHQRRINVDIVSSRLIAVIEINGISYIRNFDKA